MPGVNIQKREMANFHSPVTFCEVTYDSDWMNFDDDRHLTPYRYSLMRNNDVETNSDTVSLTLPSYTYYEYLRSLYDCRTTPSRAPPGYHGPPGGHISQQGRATTWHTFNRENGSEFSRQAVRSEPTRIRSTYPFPTLLLMQGGDGSGDELDDEFIYADRTREKLVWVDALNKWVPEKKLQPRPYMSFIGNVPVIEKQGKCTKEHDYDQRVWSAPAWVPGDSRIYIPLAYQIEKPVSLVSPHYGFGVSDDDSVVQTCERFEVHMGKHPTTSSTTTTTTTTQPEAIDMAALNRRRNNEKRDAIRRRAQELAEQKKQRKAYSTPLYTSINERKQNMKPRVQSSRAHSSLPVSPIQRKEKVPSPKQVWQTDEAAKLRTIHEPRPEPQPIKKEISITLTSPQPEELEDELEDLKDLGSEKKVTFTDQQTDTGKDSPKSGKKCKEDNSAGTNLEEENAKRTEQRLIESLEKQRQLQIKQQQKLLAEEERRKMMERKEKERLEEEERLKKLKESREKQKQPLSSNNHENYYENTMNAAAGLLFSQKTCSDLNEKSGVEFVAVDKADSKNLKDKKVKTDAKKGVKQSQEDSVKNIKENVTNKTGNTETENDSISKSKSQKLEKSKSEIEKPKKEKSKMKDDNKVVESKKSETKPVLPKLNDEMKDKKFVKIIDKVDKTDSLGRENTDNSVKLSKGKRRKGKGNASKAQPKPAKLVEKTPKKSKKIEEDKSEEKKLKPKRKKEPPAPLPPTPVPVLPSLGAPGKTLISVPSKPTLPRLGAHTAETVFPSIKAPTKTLLVGKGAPAKPISAISQEFVIEKTEKLPITSPTEVEPVEDIVKPKSPAQERRKSIIEQREIIKKERRDARKCTKKVEEVKQELPEVEVEASKVDSWIYGADNFSEKTDEEKESNHVEPEQLPTLAGDLNPELIEKEKQEKKEKRRKGVLAHLLNTDKAAKKWKKPGQLDSSYADELRRLELAEERRKKQMEMFERLKNRKHNLLGDVDDDGTPRFEDYGFLAKYCIFTKGNIEMYRHAFDAVDEDKTGWLEGEDVMIALRGVNNKLTEAEEEYLYRVLELTGYKITHGADFKIFSVLAALSQRISALDKWMKNLIGQMDFKALEMKMFKCKTLWECNVDKETNSISIDQLCVDLRAGGVSFEHEMEVREKLAHLHSIDLLDFLTYIPLFIMIHEAVVKNPLSDVRDK